MKSADEAEASTHIAAVAGHHAAVVQRRYSSVFQGFVTTLPEAAAIAMSRDDRVEYVEEVSYVYTSAPPIDGGISAYTQVTGVDNGLWHLDRTDERQVDDNGLDGAFLWCPRATNVRAYIVDSGVRKSHFEFEPGQVLSGYNAVGDGGAADDPCAGFTPPYIYSTGYHGTAVASIVGGKTFGYAKGVTIVPVRIFSCDEGATDTAKALDGLNWIHANGVVPAIINMSWFTAHSESIRAALLALESNGFVLIASANNKPNQDACALAPAQYARNQNGPVITVGGTMLGWNGSGTHSEPTNDYRWQNYSAAGVKLTGWHEGSSWGPCVDIWAPAKDINFALYTSVTDSGTGSGTSFSAPLVGAMIINGYLKNLAAAGPTTAADAFAWLLSHATLQDSYGSALVRDVVTTHHGRMAHYLPTCRTRPIS